MRTISIAKSLWAFTAISWLLLLSGCVSAPYSQVDAVKKYATTPGVPAKPAEVAYILHQVRQPEVAVPPTPDTGNPFPMDPVIMSQAMGEMGIFSKTNQAYLAEVFSRLTSEMKREDIVYFGTKNVTGGQLRFVQDKEWGDTLSVAGTVKPMSGGAVFTAAFFGIINTDVEAMGFRVNQQGQIIAAQHSTVAIGTIGSVGYVHEGRKIDAAATETVEDGVTTQEQVKAKFGMPEEIKTLKDGSVVWVYSYKKTGRSVGMMFVPGANLFSKNKVREYEIFEVRFKEGVALNHGYVDQMK